MVIAISKKSPNLNLLSLCHRFLYIFFIFYNLDQWYEYNDEKVHEVGASLVENVQAYILFYIKREMGVNFS